MISQPKQESKTTNQQVNETKNESSLQNKQGIQNVKTQNDSKQSSQKHSHNESHDKKAHQSQVEEQEIPEHFYDSDIASVCQKDFMSDNEPPKDIIEQRKLLYKQKLLHVFKTIIRVGTGIDKPAKYDRIKIKHKQVPKNQIIQFKKENKKEEKEKQEVNQKSQIATQKIQQKEPNNSQASEEVKQNNNQPNTSRQQTKNTAQEEATLAQIKASQKLPSQKAIKPQSSHPPYYSTSYLDDCQTIEYNIGNQFQQIQRLITSMKRGQTALFQFQYLTVSKKSNIKVKSATQVHVIHAFDWTTVIDLDGDKKLLKYMFKKGEGAFRVAFFDKISFNYSFRKQKFTLKQQNVVNKRLQKQFALHELPKTVWRVLSSMKDKQQVQLPIKSQDLKQYEGEDFYNGLESSLNKKKQSQQNQKIEENTRLPKAEYQKDNIWILKIYISNLTKVDDVYLDGRILKQTLTKGVSTAKPESSSLVFYALKFLNQNQEVLKADQCFDSDWWQDFGKLDQLKGMRKNYLDEYKVSKMLKSVIKRMKPAEIALVQCRDKQLFQYGCDYQEMKSLLNFTQTPDKIKMMVRVYNFTEAKTAFNMQIEQKIIESRRKKQVAIKLLGQNKIQKALKRFQNIIAYYSSQKINQQAYDQKVSALMNAILCYMKLKKYPQMIKLCNQVLQKPRHGHQFKDIKIVGPGNAKIQGNLNKGIEQNQTVEDKPDGDTRRIATDLIQNQKIIDKCLYRKSLALYEMGQCAQSLKSIEFISQNMKNTQQVLKLKKDAIKGKQKYEEKSKKIFKSMFG